MKQQGKIIAVLPPASGTSKKGNPWRSQEFVLETQEQYPRKLAFKVMKDDILNMGISVGHVVEIDFDIDAREWQGRWFNSVTCWKVSFVGQSQPAPQQAPQQTYASAPPPQAAPVQQPVYAANDDKDDLPF